MPATETRPANTTATTTPTHFVPSSWHLEQQIAAAMAKCDSDVEQARLRKEARDLDREIKAQAHATAVRSRIKRWGV
jgi:hypothetical protein